VDEDVTGDDVDEELILDLNEHVVMEDAADYDAARHGEDAGGREAAAALPSASDATIGATAAAEEETTGSYEEEVATVTVAPNVINNGAVKEHDKATSPSMTSSNASAPCRPRLEWTRREALHRAGLLNLHLCSRPASRM
jgi:hypothetical protein